MSCPGGELLGDREDGRAAQLTVSYIEYTDGAIGHPAPVGGRARVEDAEPVARHLVEWDVRVAEYYEPRVRKQAPQARQPSGRGPAVVNHRRGEAVDRQRTGRRRAPSDDIRAVIVARDHGDWRVLGELIQYGRDAYIPGVQDEVRGAQVLRDTRRARRPAPRP